MTSGLQTTTTLAANSYLPVDNGGPLNVQISASLFGNFFLGFTASAQSNSTSVTLSSAFTALTFTQTSTGNTVHLKAAPVNGEIQGFSINGNVTNLTVSAAANTVSNGASAGATSSAGSSYWWLFQSSNTTWYRFNGDVLGT